MEESIPNISWNDFLAELQEHYSLAGDKATVRHMMYFMQILLEGLRFIGLADAPVQALTAKAMRQILQWLQQEDCPRNLCPATIKKFLSQVKTAINWGVDEGLLDINPIHNVRFKKGARYERTPNLPEGALEVILEATADGTYTGCLIKATILLAADTGIRPQELCAIQCQNLNLANRRLLIPEADAKTSGGLVSFGQVTAQALEDYLQTRAGRAGAHGQEHFFLNSRGQPLAYRHWFRLFKQYVARAGHPDLTPYSLRVFFATRHFDLGTSREAVQCAMRHKNPEMTIYYEQVSKQERAARALSNCSLMDHTLPKGPAFLRDTGDLPAISPGSPEVPAL